MYFLCFCVHLSSGSSSVTPASSQPLSCFQNERLIVQVGLTILVGISVGFSSLITSGTSGMEDLLFWQAERHHWLSAKFIMVVWLGLCCTALQISLAENMLIILFLGSGTQVTFSVTNTHYSGFSPAGKYFFNIDFDWFYFTKYFSIQMFVSKLLFWTICHCNIYYQHENFVTKLRIPQSKTRSCAALIRIGWNAKNARCLSLKWWGCERLSTVSRSR